MVNILILSSNSIFKQDLQDQVAASLRGYTVNENEAPDILVLDEPKDSIGEIRDQYPQTPIIVLLKKGEHKPDDTSLIKYLLKPVLLNVFFDLLRSVINFMVNSEAGVLSFNGYLLFPLEKEIQNTKTKEKIKLTEREVSMLQYLYKTKDKPTSKIDFLKEVWGYNPEVSTHTIETHVYRLRQKIEKNDKWPQLITTENGGYKLNF